MSVISSAYDAVKARMIALYPNHFALTNPYAPDQNNEQVLKQGWGLRINGGVNTNRNVSCMLSVERTIEVVLTRKFYAAEFNRTAKEVTEKLLLEDQFLIIKDVEKDPTAAYSSILTKFGYTSDNGIEFVFTEDKPYLMLISSFTLEYFENLN